MNRYFLAGSALVSLMLSPAAFAGDDSPPVISVSGVGKTETPPDRVTIGYSVRGEGKTQEDAVKALAASRKQIENGLGVFKKEIVTQTSRMNVSEVRGSECKRYGSNVLSEGECAIVGYVATLSVSIESPAVADSGTIVGQISRLGGWKPQIEQFSLAHPEDAARKAILAATEDAARKAAVLAEGLHVKLGTVKSVTLEYGGSPPVMPLRAAMGAAGKMDGAPEAASAPIAVDLQPTPIETVRNIQVTYRIGL